MFGPFIMAAIVASKVKRERQLHESKDPNQQPQQHNATIKKVMLCITKGSTATEGKNDVLLKVKSRNVLSYHM